MICEDAESRGRGMLPPRKPSFEKTASLWVRNSTRFWMMWIEVLMHHPPPADFIQGIGNLDGVLQGLL